MWQRKRAIRFLQVLTLALLAGAYSACGGGDSASQPGSANTAIETFVSNLNTPVAMAFAPDGRLFFNELKTGKVRIIQNGALLAQAFAILPVETSGERGLLGLALDPQFATNHFVYVMQSDPAGKHRVLRFTDSAGVGTGQTVIVDNLPSTTNHNGGNIGFGHDGKLYVTVGDHLDPANSQSQTALAGKLLRYNPDGTVPADNPFGAGNPGFNLGLRNSFDFTFHPQSGAIYASENGPDCDDEINQITAGANYGWRPNYPCGDSDPAFKAPLRRFNPVTAPTGITFYTGTVLSGFTNNLFLVDFNNGRIQRFVVDDVAKNITSSDVLFNGGAGPLFDIVTGPDGFLYFSTQDSIMRIVPR
jgi:aldose sugar dehydrogenase